MRLVLVLAVLAGSAQAALTSVTNPSLPIVSDGADTEAGLVRIRCTSGERTHLFRGVIIATAAADAAYEVILTASHGLPTDRGELKQGCGVITKQGQAYGIEEVWRPDSAATVGVNDWAVLLTDRGRRSQVKRLNPVRIESPIGEQLAASKMPARLPLLYVGAERACNLTRPASSGAAIVVGLFVHTCRAWAGHSGSPILTNIEGEPHVVGIHLGKQWIYENQTAVGIGRYVDAAIEEAINAAVARGQAREAASTTQRRKRRRERARDGTVLR